MERQIRDNIYQHQTHPMTTNATFKPILFSAPMVQAILRGEKTQTRRIIKKQENEKIEFDNSEFRKCFLIVGNGYIKRLKCPYQIGDILWVRETWRKAQGMPIGCPYEYFATAEADGVPLDEPWKPSIHMPKAAARLFLRLKGIRIQRLNNITAADAIAEGVERWVEQRLRSRPTHYKVYYQEGPATEMSSYTSDPVDSFSTLWQLINGPKSWEENPWVWAYDFEQIEVPVDWYLVEPLKNNINA